jgi:5-(carboxyamino)imidazole ribonucleotide synthase
MKKTIGIIGGGQLGRMLTEAAHKLGFEVVVIDPTPNCPAAQVGAHQIKALLTDKKAVQKLANKSDFITVEIEHIDTKSLQELEESGKMVNPRAQTLKIIQNKYEQKLFLQSKGIAVADFADLVSWDNAVNYLRVNGSMYLKSKFNAYDGRGNWNINSISQLDKTLTKDLAENFYIEKHITVQKEFAVMVAKDIAGNTISYPVTQSIHKRSICIETKTPAKLPSYILNRAQALAEKTVACFEGAGMYGVELFLVDLDTIIVNEVAPRVHNSGHYTLDGCTVSQFEQHIRAISGMKLGDASLVVPAVSMINILGERNGPTKVTGVNLTKAISGVSVYMYGKSPTKIDRKMGHINAVGDTIEEARYKAMQARKLITV